MELKRRRVTQACDRCRALKSKCDGKQPVCTRCKAYGYTCNWQVGKRRGPPRTNPLPEAASAAAGSSAAAALAETESLRSAVQAYDELATQLRARLPDAERNDIDSILSSIRRHLPHELLPKDADADSPGELDDTHSPPTDGPRDSYHGEASDVYFFHAVKHAIQGQARTSSLLRLESYQRDYRVNHGGVPRIVPTREEADRDVEWFFRTYNRSLPLMCERTFRREYERYWKNRSCDGVPGHFFPTLLSICAVSELYHNLMDASAGRSRKHEAYYAQAWHVTKKLDNDYSRPVVLLMILQCQYLIMTCQFDRCWMVLSLAVRMAQILGFHVIDDPHCNRPQPVCTQIEKELRRRVWHACYTLDTVLALQLGRPPCINPNDSIVNYPSAHHDSLFDYENDTFLPMSPGPQPGTILEHHLTLSHIIGNVVHDLYAPKRPRTSRSSIAVIEALDQKLLAWKHGLPPHLRFDLDHSVEEDAVFERQRCGLAWNFHNLRTLIHRPHVCVGTDNTQLESAVRQQIVASGQICIAEAQIVARMLYRTTNRPPHSYSWYHFIPFVVGTCSILLVASRYPTATTEGRTADNEQLEADVANCVQLLDSYAQVLRPAKSAADMIRTLQSSRRTGDSKPSKRALDSAEAEQRPPHQSSSHIDSVQRHGYHINHAPRPYPHHPHPLMAAHGQNSVYTPTIPSNTAPHPMQSGSELNFSSNEQWQAWPEDYFDSLMWSSQFVLPTEYNMSEGPWNIPVSMESQQGQQGSGGASSGPGPGPGQSRSRQP